jgi:hypothetical protein
MKKINEEQRFKPTLDKPVSVQSKNFDGNFKKTSTSKYKGHSEWWSATRDPVIFNAEYVGRFDNKTKILSIGLAGKAGLFTKAKINQVPKDLLQILKFEFGDHVKIKTFENS